MKKRIIGSSSLLVSEIGLGCMSLPTELESARSVLDEAVDHGINYFDTADLYDKGTNEELIGKVLKEKRQDLIIATKAGNKWQGEDSWIWDSSKAHIMDAVKKSLRRLQLEHIDLYQLHGGTMEDDVEETIEAFDTLKKEGIIREYGISSIRPTVIERFLSTSQAVSVMMQYNLLDRRPEEYFSLIAEKGASVVARGTLAKGLLTNEGVERAKNLNGFVSYSQFELQQTVQTLSNETNDLQAYAIAFVLKEPAVASALIGSRTQEQLRESLKAYDSPIDSQLLTILTNKIEPHQYEQHRV
ncbi:oxidoreductase [Sporosarcina sp. P21c]|uniref:aldo/keto reductase n=1 Tax=unclassified Sporosarcina TaxID=2647733 RepID=UPI000C165E0A|nr:MULTISPECIES: aldo/keto reductase [unclassified Sporosarcina]PIC68655.1 oxidoreductase [Sporosarcina sp. P16a]PIC91159.1 oxidoreductase [Sporosarcina sp. P21c]PIC93708.1 oxidoreductase [Sporosarcina sp. P25]